jgi:hypothetical protein
MPLDRCPPDSDLCAQTSRNWKRERPWRGAVRQEASILLELVFPHAVGNWYARHAFSRFTPAVSSKELNSVHCCRTSR